MSKLFLYGPVFNQGLNFKAEHWWWNHFFNSQVEYTIVHCKNWLHQSFGRNSNLPLILSDFSYMVDSSSECYSFTDCCRVERQEGIQCRSVVEKHGYNLITVQFLLLQ
jgi:hypothetical protein